MLGCNTRPQPSTQQASTVATTTSAAATATATTSAPTAKRQLPAGTNDPPRLALGTQGAVASQERNASAIGIDVLKRGGNAVDAAIAVAFALAVTHPSAGNIGGGGFMVIHMADGRTAAIDYRETAPSKASRDMYLDARGKPTDASLLGPKAAGIPGSVAGMALAHKRFGSLPFRELVLPAARLAKDGVRLDPSHAEGLARARKRMRDAGLHKSASFYEPSAKRAYRAGEIWKQPQLAKTLEAIASGGADAFYRGPLAQQMADQVSAAGGLWRAQDLANYKAVERKPIRFDYRGHTIIAMPPPSAGGIVLRQILAASEIFNLAAKPYRHPSSVHFYVEATRRAYADRNGLLGDPDVVSIPSKLLELDYIRSRLSDIDPKRATPSSEVKPGKLPKRASEQTTHFSVIDGHGNAVANTTTLNTGFGSKFVIPAAGVLLNNEMDDFSVKPGSANVYGLVQSEPNAIAPNKRMLSSMTPTIVLRDKQVRAVLGSPGGPTISTTVAQLLMALLDHDERIDAAVAAPRIHHQWLPDQIYVERTVAPSLITALRSRGHRVKKRGSIGNANCIEVDPVGRGFRAVADTARGGGVALAY